MVWKNRIVRMKERLLGTPGDGKGSPSGIMGLYLKWGRYSFIFTLICIAWLVWRVGTKPSRIGYPCTQFALGQIVLYFGLTSIPCIGLVHTFISYIRRREYVKVGRLVLVIIVVFGCFAAYQGYQENRLRERGGGTILASTVTSSPLLDRGPETSGQTFSFPHTISPGEAVVSFSHDPLIGYGAGSPPFDPVDNPAYDFVWEAVERLDLGSLSSPLEDLISPGDTVLIKPNWVDFGPAVYTRPEVVRPLIDMAVFAGAARIIVGDGGGTYDTTVSVMNDAGYASMVGSLNSLYTGVDIETVNLNALSNGWHWVSMGSDSSFAGSGYVQYDLGAGGVTLFEHTYYSTPDPQGVNPGGDVMGWYAVSDEVLAADVIINVSKMKTHELMMATMSIKNLVGCTIGSTYNEDADDCQPRIPHSKTEMEDNFFNNDIFWRAILDMSKILLYADENGIMQLTQQRMYLNVVDGIQALEKSEHHEYGGGGLPYDRHVVLAGVDPAAVDAVGTRIMGYDYTVIPSVNNTVAEILHPIGTNDPEDIVVIGDTIDSDIDHVFIFNDNWSADAGSLGITDFAPPTINTIARQDATVTADISGGQSAHVVYETSGVQQAVKMSKSGDTYTATVPETVTDYRIVASDEFFNTTSDEPSYISVTIIDNGAAGLDFGELAPGGGRQPEAAAPSVTITTGTESGNVGIYLMGTDFTGPAGTITIENAFYSDTDDSGSAAAMQDAFDNDPWKTMGPDETLYIYHWLSIPEEAWAGGYSSTFTYKAEEIP